MLGSRLDGGPVGSDGSSMLVAVWLGLTVTPGAFTPWYAAPECLRAYDQVQTQDLEAGRSAIDGLSGSDDPELRLCALWLEIPYAQGMLSVEGKSERLFQKREKDLRTLYGVARKYGRKGRPHWLDLTIEARMRRAQLLAQRQEHLQSVDEARGVQRALARTDERPETASREYTEGAIDYSVGNASWGLRMLLSSAGIQGDPERGRRTLEHLAKEDTVYATEALLLLFQLSRETAGGDDPASLEYGRRLVGMHPRNPQFAYDHGDDLRKAGRCSDTLSLLAPFRQRLKAEPLAWSDRVRRKLHGLVARCAVEVGDYALARQAHQTALAQEHWFLQRELKAVGELLASKD